MRSDLSDVAAAAETAQARAAEAGHVGEGAPAEGGEFVTGSGAVTAAATGVAAVTAIRFCRECGRAWAAGAEACVCAGAVDGGAAAARVYDDERSDVKWALAMYFSILLVVGIATFVAVVQQRESAGVVSGFLVQGSIGLIAIVGTLRQREAVLPLLRKRPAAKWLGMSVVASLITAGLGMLMLWLMAKAGMVTRTYLKDYEEARLHMGWAVLGVCVMPALFEELAFRGVVQSALGRVLGTVETILVTSLLFAILHLSVVSIPLLFTVGVALATVRRLSGSLWPGVLLHFLHNFWVLLAERLAEG